MSSDKPRFISELCMRSRNQKSTRDDIITSHISHVTPIFPADTDCGICGRVVLLISDAKFYLNRFKAAFTPGHVLPGNMCPERATCIRIHIC